MEIRLSLNNLQGYARLMRLDKPVGIYLLLWPTLWALILAAGGLPGAHITAVFVAGVVLMRSAGCIINDYADRKVDGAVERTRNRPLVTGQVTEAEALQLFALLVLLAFMLVLTLNWQTIALSVPALLLAASYPFMKRYTYLPQVVLGAAFGWAIPMAFAAVLGYVPMWGWLVFFANLAWTVAYDSLYAMVDRDDDLKVGIKSSAILFGRQDLLIIGLLQLTTLVLLLAVARIIGAGWPVYLALGICAGLFVHQQFRARNRSRNQCFQAFLENHYIGLVMTLGLLLDTLV
ncbi:4-hydroxybenzoate octaprenyltransferase [Alteromonas aestuariivivens]|uniref:4-hydroxybenzoate octaprenyltransferase n=1 Tax=Alteromonas aestuariivivens TaxID=1938339 RepID=A0A3D8M300_9ALTE|nr:4-hydroxybenzoate octaprenyltransferase [Alteromonas aestuariivivens]RDV23980.1 4-hydroxybenzoate octaprenyltransferase [Alteromonas aestuariivivens]